MGPLGPVGLGTVTSLPSSQPTPARGEGMISATFHRWEVGTEGLGCPAVFTGFSSSQPPTLHGSASRASVSPPGVVVLRGCTAETEGVSLSLPSGAVGGSLPHPHALLPETVVLPMVLRDPGGG